MTVRIDPSNADQLTAWDGPNGEFWTARADRFDQGVARYQPKLLAAAAVDPADNVLDIGCGSGTTTRDLARAASCGTALGVDLSSQMLRLARERAAAEQLTNVTFEQRDAQIHPFPEGHFDVVVSRNGAMFFGDPAAAFKNIARAIRSGGRLVLLTWQALADNEWLSTFRAVLAAGRDLPMPPPTAPSPFSLSDPDRVRSLLAPAGFENIQLQALREPMYFGKDTEDAYDYVHDHFCGLVKDLEAEVRESALEQLRANLAEHQTAEGVVYDSAAWLIEARLAG
ncbi:SAM-dependent methyltransferase [Kibdelosporangium banguiense]|uniref:SAM-dependent methyltransferase n=1 Tax=Kibdelosporangium banguiense TaxID=1365924 RepID=A0ABS4TJ15_9PSEU|nr:class I SAM-dependent methyltransferase [Kibdelosporangium banguiense]MBP2324417.1 SAM-dependent methyltransferase [Kibdelosporangium banguiense]